MVTHQLQVERRTGKVRRPETDVLPLCHATNLVIDYRKKMLMKKYVVVRKIEKVVVVNGSRGLQKTELQDLQLGVVM